MINIISENKLFSFEPGVSFQYSKMGYLLLIKIIERVSGQKYKDFITDNFLTPNNLIHTRFLSLNEKNEIKEELLNYNENDNINTIISGSGLLVTNAEDLNKWYSKLFNGEAGISINNVKYLIMNSLPTENPQLLYGLGCINVPKLGYGSFGEYNGLWNLCMYDIEKNTTIIVFLINDTKNPNYNEMLAKLVDIALNVKEVINED